MNKEGWAWLLNALKWHYFIDGRSLCHKWMIFTSDLEIDRESDLPSNCKACQKALKKLQEQRDRGKTFAIESIEMEIESE